MNEAVVTKWNEALSKKRSERVDRHRARIRRVK
jgi:hypothetical protein